MSLPIIVKNAWTMATMIEQQVALDEALVPSTKRCPFFKAFLVTVDVPKIYMQEFWATAYVHQYSIRFKMDSKKNIVDLETFRDMLHICHRVLGQSFDELPFEEEILDFLRFLGHSAQIKTLTDVNVDKLFQPWRSFAAVINKCLTGKSFGFNSFRNTKAYKEYYACATGEAAPKTKASARRKKSGSDTSITPPTAITTPTTTVAAALRLTAAAKGKQPAKAKSPTDPSEVARTETEQLKIVLRRSRQESHISQLGGFSTDEGIGSKLGVPDVPSDDSEEEISWNSLDDEDVDAQDKDINDDEGDKEDESDDGKEDDDDADKDGAKRDADDDDDDDEEEIAKIDKPEDTESGGGDDEVTESDGENSEDDGNGEEDQGLRVSEEQRLIEEEEADELYRDQESSSVSSQFVSNMLNPTSDAGMESIFTTASSPMAPLQTSTPIMTPSTIATITTISHAHIPPTTIPSEVLQNLPTFDSVFRFEDRLKSLEVNFSKFIQTNQFAEADIPGIVHQYMNQQMTEARIIKEQVKSQVKEKVSRILLRIKESVNAQLEVEVLTRSSNSSRTSYGVAADLSKMELKKIIIEKMEGNKSIQRSDEQRNLYKALVDAYEAYKTILDSYRETAILKRRREDDDDQEGPSAGSDRESKRQREGGEPESVRAPLEPATRSAGRSTTGSKSLQASASESAFAEEPVQTISQIEESSHLVFETGAKDQPIVQTSQHPKWFSLLKKPPTPDRDWNKTLPAVQGSAQTWISELAKQAGSRSSFNELLDTPLDFSNFIMNRLGVDTLTSKLLARPTYELMRGSCNSLTELEYHLEEVYKATTDQLDWVNPEVTDLKIVEWHNYKHLDWISVRRDDDKIYKFKEVDFKRLRLQDIEDMLLLLVQGKLSNLTVEERFAFNVSLRMFRRSIVIYRPWNGLLEDDCMRETFRCCKGPYDWSYAAPIFTERRREDDDDQEGPSVGSDQGSKRPREGGEPESASTPSEPATRSAGKSTKGTQSRQMSGSAEDQPIVQTSQHPEWFSHPKKPITPDRNWNKTLQAVQGSAQTWISELAKQADSRSSFNELLDTPLDFFNFIMNRLGVDTLTPELLAGPTYELMRGHPLPLIPDNRGRRVIPFAHFINNDLEYLRGVAADLLEMELKNIFIEKMEGNKSIQRSDEQRNLYKALIDAYEADKTILDSYGETAILKRRREDDDDQEGPSAGSDRGSKRPREGGEPESASTPSEPATRSAGKSTKGTQSRHMSGSAEDQPIVQTSQHPEWFSHPKKPPTPD
nr:hypothetical protein [Tanacetum cinerariifolium]